MPRNDEGHTTATHRLLVTAAEASKQLAISPRTLWAITAPRGPLPVVRLGPSGRAVRYAGSDLLAFIERKKTQGTCQ